MPIDMSKTDKKISISTKKPLDGITFNKRVEPTWIKESNKYSKEISRIQRHAEYCQYNFDNAFEKYNQATDSIQKQKLKQDMEYWLNQLKEARKNLADLSREFASFHKKNRR